MSFSSHTRPTNYHCHFLVLVSGNMLSKCRVADPDHPTVEIKPSPERAVEKKRLQPSRKTGSNPQEKPDPILEKQHGPTFFEILIRN